jgi:ribosomal protein L1
MNRMMSLRFMLSQVRFRRYRPFSVPVKPKKDEGLVPTSTATTTVSSDPSTTLLSDNRLFQVGPLQAMKILEAFSPMHRSTEPPYITLTLTLDVDTKRQSVRGVCHLPHGLKSRSKIAVFCSDFDAAEMIEAGADCAGMTELLQRIGKGWTGFDRCIATPAVMPQVMKVAKVLGPRKLMPNPKSGTLVTDLKRAIIEAKSGTQLEYRTGETEPVVVVKIGSLDTTQSSNLENMKFFIREILKQKNRKSADTGADDVSGGRLVTVGGISMLPDAAKLSRLLSVREKTTKTGDAKSKNSNLFIQTASVGIELPSGESLTVDLNPELILPTSPAYYRV